MQADSVVVGFDGSTNGRAAVHAAIDLTGEGSTVHVVTAYDPPSAGETARLLELIPAEFRTTYDPLTAPRGHLQDAVALLEAAGRDHVGHFVESEPADAILDVAESVDADMIVVGSRGLGRASRFLRGSVSSRIASHARCSFMVIQGDD